MAIQTRKTSQLQRWMDGMAQGLFSTFAILGRLVAFTLITFGTMVSQAGKAPRLFGPLIREQIFRTGVRLVPMMCFLGLAVGLLIVGQTEAVLQQVGAAQYTGTLWVSVIVRELAPLLAGFVIFGRVGTASVIELGTSRALGEVEALEALGIDPVHYLVVPRLIGFTLSAMALSLYCILFAVGSGYIFAYSRGLSIAPSDYLARIGSAISWADFPLLMIKTSLFGAITSMVVCYQGLARPLRLEEIGDTTARTVVICLVACLCVDALFIPLYLML